MSAISFELSKRLEQGPAVLFIGQNYLHRSDTGSNPFLELIVQKYSDGMQATSYDQILHLGLPSPDVFLSWARERIDQYISTPPWLPTVAKFAWNNVYTSAIDTLWYKNFKTDWRELFPIYLEKTKPAEIRSRGILSCTFLFGCIDQPANDPNYRPPLSTLEKNKRKQEAIALLRRLPEIVTPFGTLVIEGYDGFSDWISWDDLLPIIDSLQPGQTHLFSVTKNISQHSDIQTLIKQQKIIIHSENLASYIIEHNSEIKMGLLKEDVEGKKRIAIGEKVLYVPHELFNSVSRTATLVDDSIFEPLPLLQPDGTYIEFRRFLANSGKQPVWSGYYWGFNFKRDFEKQLSLKVIHDINSVSLQKTPIILHGPSGTGKTVALGSLAFDIRKEKRCAVLFIERKSVRPSYSDLDEFSTWAEHNGSPVTLIIWDGMVDADEYSRLLSYLTGRGRKVVIVGSCYELPETKNSKNYIYATSDFGNETSNFENHLINISPAFKQVIEKLKKSIDPYFLVMLYRMLPETVSQLQDGIINEVNYAQQQLVLKTSKENIPENSLAHYFLEVGLISEEDLSLTKSVTVDNEEIMDVEKIIGLIMVPGRFGLSVPVELIVRAMNRTWLQTFTDILGEISFFSMDFDENTGVISVGPRHPLEAKFIVDKRMGGVAATEVDYASKLLLELSPSAEIDSYEFQFAVDLIRRLGPNGDDRAYFAPHFKTLAAILEELRTQRSIVNPRLMLQEAVLLREWLKNLNMRDEEIISDEEKLKTYHKAAQILEEAQKGSSSTMRSTILAELAANLGAENKVNISRGAATDALDTYKKAKKSIVLALKHNPADYHPLDVVAWMSQDLIESNLKLSDNERAELAAEWFHLFSLADENEYSDQQRILYNSKMATLARIIDNEKLLEKSLQMLERIGSKAGYYLQAFWIIRDNHKHIRNTKTKYLLLPTNEPAKDEDVPGYVNALRFLDEHEKEIGEDSRCLNLKFKLWWLIKTKKPLFLDERDRLAFTLDDWKYLLNLMNRLLETSDLFYATPIKYAKALALFHLGNYQDTLELFREIDRESAQNGKGPKRIFRHYLASNEKGEPIQYTGRILWVDLEQDRGQVYVPALSKSITFIPRDFPRWNEMRKDQPLPSFHIAFNFIGPIADPISRLHKNR